MILCCGEALIDMVPRRTAEGEACFLPLPGGAVFNTAIALGRLGAPVGFFSGISTDVFGRQLMQALEAAGVDTRHVARSDRPTTLAIVELQDGQARYSFMDENSAGRMLTDADAPRDLSGMDALFFGGISLCAEPAAGVYERLCLSQAGQRTIMLDPNIRPSFIADEAEYRARIGRMISAADIVKVSDEDAAWLVPEAGSDAVEAGRRLAASGPGIVIVTRGADGAMAFRGNGEPIEVPGRPARVVDTVGAGDTFNAGFLAGLHARGRLARPALGELSDDDLRAALDLGCRAASVTVSRAGANPPLLDELPPAEG